MFMISCEVSLSSWTMEGLLSELIVMTGGVDIGCG